MYHSKYSLRVSRTAADLFLLDYLRKCLSKCRNFMKPSLPWKISGCAPAYIWYNPANIRVGEDVLKTSSRHLQGFFSVTFFCLPRRLENVLKTSCKTSWRHFRKTYCKYVLNPTSRRLQEVLEDEKCYAEDVFKTSWRRLENKKCLLGSNLIFIDLNFIDKIYRNLSGLMVWYLKR